MRKAVALMSRSYKKEPVTKDNQRGGARYGKRRSAHRLRRVSIDTELPTRERKFFTKYFGDMYEIHDFICRWTWEEALAWFESLSEERQDWILGRGKIGSHYPRGRVYENFYDYWKKTQLGK